MDELIRYQQDFDNIVTTLQHAYYKQDIAFQAPFYKSFYESITTVRNNFVFDEQDVRQQLRLIWIELIGKYYKTKPQIHIRQYLIKCSAWMLRDWFRHQMLIQSEAPKVFTTTSPPFSLDLSFLLQGTDYFPLSTLNPYERYLLYLQYKENKSVSQIAYIVQHDRATVTNQLNILTNKLQQLKQEGFNSWQQRIKQN
jgi:hypothetical protein